jgi:thiamine biosynthesis lipoprotein
MEQLGLRDDSPALGEAFTDACAEESLVRHEASHAAMGTVFSIAAYGSNSERLQGSLARSFQEIDRLDNLMSHYKPQSELSTINREASHRTVVVPPELLRLLEDSLRFSEQTCGAFDITVGPLMKSWGFFRGWVRLPEPRELEQAMRRTGYRHVKLDAATHTVRFDEPGVELDLGAIGKGCAVDRVVEILRADGVSRALVSGGTSSIYAIGAPPGEHGWEISVCDPFDRRKQACSLRLQNMSISISGSQEKSFVLDGKLYTHLLDPRNGRPVEDMLMTVVIAASNAAGDALSTAFFVSGVKQTQAYIENHPNLTAIFYMPMGSSPEQSHEWLDAMATSDPWASPALTNFCISGAKGLISVRL